MSSKLSWSLCSALAGITLSSSACSLLQVAGLTPKPTPPYEGGLLVQQPTGVVWAGTIKDVGHPLEKLPQATVNSTSDKKGQWFPQYCQSGKQVRDVTQKIRLVIPRPPKGLALAAAQNKAAELKQVGEAMIPLFFQYASDPSDVLILKEGEKYPAVRSFALQSGKSVDLEKEFQNPRSTVGGVVYINRFVFLKPTDSDVVYLVPNRFTELHWGLKYFDAGIYSNHPIPGRSGLFALTPERSIRAKNLTTQPYNAVSVLAPARNMALYDFHTNFTALISATKVQEDLPELQSIFLNPDGSISTAKALQAKEQFWKFYLQKFTTVKEAQSDNPAFKDYEVSLDLNLFCTFGRQTMGLLSK